MLAQCPNTTKLKGAVFSPENLKWITPNHGFGKGWLPLNMAIFGIYVKFSGKCSNINLQTSVYILALPFLTSTKGAGGRIGRNSSGNGPLPLDMASKRRLWSEVHEAYAKWWKAKGYKGRIPIQFKLSWLKHQGFYDLRDITRQALNTGHKSKRIDNIVAHDPT